jgi:Leucine-rich repeat (LRR) protein
VNKPFTTGSAAVATLTTGILCALGLTWLGCSDDATAVPKGELVAQGIPAEEFDLFANLIQNIDKAQTNFDAAKSRGNPVSIREAGTLLAQQQQILTQLYVDKHGAETIAKWAQTVRAASTAPSALLELPPSLKELTERLNQIGARSQVNADGNMYQLDCANIKIPADLLKHFGQFKHLKNLNLSATDVTDKDLVHVKSLTKLNSLNLSRNPIEGPGLKNMSEMTALGTLNLSSTSLNDQAVRHLESINHLKKIRVLNLENTSLTSKDYERVGRLFRQADVRF